MTPYINYYLPMNFTDGFTFADGRIKMRSIVEAVIAFIPILGIVLITGLPADTKFGIIAFCASLLFFVCTMGIDGSTPSQFLMRYANYRKTRGISFYNPAANKHRSDKWSFDKTDEGGIKGIQKRAQEIVQSSGITEDTIGVESAEKILMGKKFVFKDDVQSKVKAPTIPKKPAPKGKKPLAPQKAVTKKPPPPIKKPSAKAAVPAHPLGSKETKKSSGASLNEGAPRMTLKDTPEETAPVLAPKPMPKHVREVETDNGVVPVSRMMQPMAGIVFLSAASAKEMPLQEASGFVMSRGIARTKSLSGGDFEGSGDTSQGAEVCEVVEGYGDGGCTDEKPPITDFTFD